MLNDNDVVSLTRALMITAEAMGDSLSANAAAIMADDLSEYPLEVITRSLKAVRQECKGRLALADILKRVQGHDGRPGPNEAWAIAMRASDEDATVVWNDEIAEALGVARPILEAQEKIAARMSFLEAYERITKAARTNGDPVRWYASLGCDQTMREQALKEAVDKGLLAHTYVYGDGKDIAGLLPAPMTAPGADIAGFLMYSAKRPDGIPPGIAEKLDAIKAEFESSAQRRFEVIHNAAIREREDLDRRKDELFADLQRAEESLAVGGGAA